MDQKQLARAFPNALERPERTFSIEELAKFPIFEGLPETVLKKIQPFVLDARYEKGQTILREGEFSDAAYSILSGIVEILLTTLPSLQQAPSPAKRGDLTGPQAMAARAEELAGTPRRQRAIGRAAAVSGTIVLSDIPADIKRGERAILEQGEIFGEISALSRYPVSATARAFSDVACLMIRTPALRILQRGAPKFKEFVERRYRARSLATHLRSVGLFSGCTDEFLRGLKDRVELVSFEPGELIAEEDTPADAFFLIRGGYVKVSAKSGAAELALTYLRKGDYFGETAILLDEPWPFSFSAIETVELVKLTRADFEALTRQDSRDQAHALGRRGGSPQAARRRRAQPHRLGIPADGHGHGTGPRRKRPLDRPEHLHALRRLRARVRGHAWRHPAVHPRRLQVPELARPDLLLPVHRSRLHDRLPDGRDHPAHRDDRGLHRPDDLHRLRELRPALPLGQHRQRPV